MVEDSKVSLGSMQEDAKQGPLQSNSSFHRNTDTGDGVNSLHVFQDDIDFKAVGNNAYSKHCGPQQLIVEIFSGSCRLSKACKKVGFRTTAVDKSSERSENFTIYKCDLTNPAELALLKEYFIAEQDALFHVHFAPACGTSSRARERPYQRVAQTPATGTFEK